MSAKKKPETAAQTPSGQEVQPEGKATDTAADTQPDAAPADDAHAPADNDPPAGQEEETSPAPQPDPEAAELEETPPAEQAEESPAENTELAQVKAALLAANCEIAAYKAGVDSAMVADAITLARAEAGQDADAAAIAAAMQHVLERHPEWKAPAAAKKTTGGFQLGADPDAAGTAAAPKKDPASAKRWNRFK